MKSVLSTAHESDSPSQAMDVNAALARLGNDRQLLSDIIEIFLEDSPVIIERIRSAVAETDYAKLHRAAHSLRGLAATLSASEVAGAASRLEAMGAHQNLSEALAAVRDVDRAAADLNHAVKQYLRRK